MNPDILKLKRIVDFVIKRYPNADLKHLVGRVNILAENESYHILLGGSK